VDVYFDGRTLTRLTSDHIPTANTHGSGDTLSAAVCAFLAGGMDMGTAMHHAHTFTQKAIRRSAHWQLGHGHGPVWQREG
ncbi:MAG: bifunctional hydroxymethylpyrimidine kinase/phosphomethylpyrimidine kinase, partial [Anaerolineae bacterium]